MISSGNRVPPLAAYLPFAGPSPDAAIAVDTGTPQDGHPLERSAAGIHRNNFGREPAGGGRWDG